MLRRTKIIATLGQATDPEGALEALLSESVDLVRLNLSHGTHSEHLSRFHRVRVWSQTHQKEIGIIADLQGPKIRIGSFENHTVTLTAHQSFTIDHHLDRPGDFKRVGISYQKLVSDVQPGSILLLKDGAISLRVEETLPDKIHCIVLNGGQLSSHQGLNLLGGGLSLPALTEKDLADLAFAKDIGVDYVAVSFVKEACDIEKVRTLLGADSFCQIIAKIEKKEALHNLDDIIKASDAVMVARGDLGIEMGIEEIPALQKHIIRRTRELNKAIITATQMMESMVTANIPTRAEVSDIANAVLDGTDAIMFSAETAVGNHPSLVVKTASQICISAEKNPLSKLSHHRLEKRFEKADEAIAMASVYIANHFNIKAILSFTESGMTPLWMSRIRSDIPIYALSRHIQTQRRTTLYRDVYAISFDLNAYEEKSGVKKAIELLLAQGILVLGDQVIVTQGDILGKKGGTNELKILTL